MTAYEIATLLNTGISDRKFAEVFALMDRMMYGRSVPEIYDQKSIILRMDVGATTNRINMILKEIQDLVRG